MGFFVQNTIPSTTSGSREIRLAVKSALEDGSAYLCEPVLLELWNGARGQSEKRFITQLQNTLRILTTTPDTWETSWKIAAKARSSGITVPAIDILIFSIAVDSKADLLHDDFHFVSLTKLVK